MKILCLSDSEQNDLYEGWTDDEAEKLKDVGLVLSAGDLDPEYLEFIETMLNVPLLYVRGNHDSRYDEEPPEGCVGIDDKVADLVVGEDGVADVCGSLTQEIPGIKISPAERAKRRLIRIVGLGGSMGSGAEEGEMYPEEDEFTEEEMASRCSAVNRKLLDLSIQDRLKSAFSGSSSADNKPLGILLSHSPSFGHGDMEDLAHRGFDCFNRLIEKWKPAYHIYGHVHIEYGMFDREMDHPAGTKLINVCGMYMLEV